MRSRLTTLLTVIGAITVLLLAGNTVAIATTGHGLILGKVNSANAATTLKRTTGGPALKVVTKSTVNPPFAINGKGKVANLNADKLDGYDSSALKTTPYVITSNLGPANNSFAITAQVPPGSYLFSYSVFIASSPSGDLGSIACQVNSFNGGQGTLSGTVRLPSGGASELAVNGSGYAVKKTTADSIVLQCSAGHNFVLSDPTHTPIQFVLTPVNGASGIQIARQH